MSAIAPITVRRLADSEAKPEAAAQPDKPPDTPLWWQRPGPISLAVILLPLAVWQIVAAFS